MDCMSGRKQSSTPAAERRARKLGRVDHQTSRIGGQTAPLVRHQEDSGQWWGGAEDPEADNPVGPAVWLRAANGLRHWGSPQRAQRNARRISTVPSSVLVSASQTLNGGSYAKASREVVGDNSWSVLFISTPAIDGGAEKVQATVQTQSYLESSSTCTGAG